MQCFIRITKKITQTRINKAKANSEQHKWKSKFEKIAKKVQIHADQLVELMLCDYSWTSFVFTTDCIVGRSAVALQLRRPLIAVSN